MLPFSQRNPSSQHNIDNPLPAWTDGHVPIFYGRGGFEGHKSIETTLTHSEGMILVGAYNDGQSLIKVQPDVVIINYHLPDRDGADISKYIKYRYPAIKIIVLTGIKTPGLVTEMLENGYSGYLLKTTTNSEILIE